jgi:hypothetical protein
MKVSRHIMHSAPLKAMDLPLRGPVAEVGVRAVFTTGSVLSETYPQTGDLLS